MYRESNTLRKRITAAAIAVTMAAVTIGSAVYLDGTRAYASRTSLRGIEDIVDAHSGASEDGLNPFVIYEVVPTYEDASLGYLVGGEEPIEDGRSIKEMPSAGERDKVRNFNADDHNYAGSLIDEAFTYDSEYTEPAEEDGRTISIRGSFNKGGDDEDVHDGSYEYYRANDGTPGGYVALETDGDGKYPAPFDECASWGDVIAHAASGQITLYRDYMTVERSDDGNYDVTQLTEVGADEYMPYKIGDYYCSQRFAVKNIEHYTDLSTGDLLYYGGKNFIGVFDHCEFTRVDGEPVADDEDYDAAPADYYITIYKVGADEPVVNGVNDTVTYEAFLTDEAYLWTIGTPDSSGEYRIGDIGDGSTFSRSTGKDVVYGAPDYDENNCPEEKGPYYFVDENLESDEYLYDEADGIYRFDADYTKGIYQSFTYKGGFANEEWFKNWVFDRTETVEYEKLCIDVIPITMEDLNSVFALEEGENAALDRADLIYFAGGNTPYGTDMDADIAKKIVNKLLDDNFPIMMEFSTYYKNQDKGNLANMCKTLMRKNYPAESVEDLEEAAQTFDEENGKRYSGDPESDDISFVHGTLFVNDDINGDAVDPESRIAGPKFHTTYEASKRNSDSFKEVKDEIENERAFLELNNAWEGFNKSISIATSIRYILNANNSRVAVKNELNILDIEPLNTAQYGSNIDVLKSGIYQRMNGSNTAAVTTSVNELSPDFLEEEWVKDNIIGAVEQGDEPSVNIRRMGTKELIGINTDLNATYDIIYIGMDTTLMNTQIRNGIKSKVTTYVNYDNALPAGMVYTHVGDTINTYNAGYSTQRSLAGNDITLDKTRELVQYIKAGYAMLLSDDFFTANGRIDTGKVDPSSNMYKLMNWLVNDGEIEINGKTIASGGDDGGKKYYGKNVMTKKMLTDTATATSSRETFARYINIAKLKINLKTKPAEYNVLNSNGEVDHHEFVEDNGDGTHTLIYEVELTNDSVVSESDATYDCRLYIDLDSDGKYEEAENIGALSISKDGTEEDTEDGKYRLRAGNTYRIVREIAEEYVGFLAWKLEFRQNGADGVRSAVIGYSAVKADPDHKPLIKVLQIMPNPRVDNVWDMFGNSLDLDSEEMRRLYQAVEDFDIDVDTVTVQNYIMKYGLEYGGSTGKSYYDYLCNYDMVVMGFTDVYHFVANARYSNGRNAGTDNGYDMNYQVSIVAGESATRNAYIGRADAYKDAALAIRQYAMSGRSILFTHDLSSYHENNNRWGYFANRYWRDIQGMDRFGTLADSEEMQNGLKYFRAKEGGELKKYESVYDTNVHNGKNTESSALTEYTVMRFNSNTSNSLTTRDTTRGYNNNAAFDYGNHKNEVVTAINEGQITQYPYLITTGTGGYTSQSRFNVKPTHSQYYQLNLDTDSTDSLDNDDVVVWYTIGGPSSVSGGDGYHTALHNDARNNYYIFSKGNVLYTGAGHYTGYNNDPGYPTLKEKQLFVNTLVAAYNAGTHGPNLLYKSNPWEDGIKKSIKSVYIPYDAQLINDDASVGGFLDKMATVNFQPINNNFRYSMKPLITRYYVKGTSSDYTIKVGDEYYKEIAPVKLSVGDGAGNLAPVDDIHSLINRSVYQGEFNIADFHMNLNGSAQYVELYIRVGIEELDDGNDFDVLPASECMEAITICGTQLRELE